jgi:hypothetical protein
MIAGIINGVSIEKERKGKNRKKKKEVEGNHFYSTLFCST